MGSNPTKPTNFTKALNFHKISFIIKIIKTYLKGGEDMIIRSWVICLTGGIFFWPDVPEPFKERLAIELKKIGAENLITE